MIYKSRTLAFLLAIGIALFSTILIWILSTRDAVSVLVFFTGILTFTFLIIYLTVDRFIFEEVRRLREDLDLINTDRAMSPAPEEERSRNPFQQIYALVHSLIEDKQHEIERLKKTEAFRKDFIADVSHELKTPIFAAQGFVHTLLDGAVKEKAVRKKFLKKAAKSLDGLDMLVQDLLTLSQIETGQIKMRFSEFDLYTLTDEILEQLRGKANKKSIELRIEGPVRKVRVFADPQRIEQVITNLVTNAIKHSEDGSEVVIVFTIRKKSVVTSVKDTGEGIPAEHINRIFERFYRVDKSRSREKGGTGLGLAIVKHILDGHGTRAEVESTPGKGSTFSFRLPRVKIEMNGITEHQESVRD